MANVAIIASGLVAAWTHPSWPDLTVGLGTLTLNVGAAREVWLVAKEERRAAGGTPC